MFRIRLKLSFSPFEILNWKKELLCVMGIGFSIVILSACNLEKENPDFRPCTLTELGCVSQEVCNGVDDDQDGQTDENSGGLCVSQNTLIIDGQGPDGIGGFGRSITSVGDLDGDGYEEVVIGSTRTREEIALRGQASPGRIVLVNGSTYEVIWGIEEEGDFGFSLASGDFNGDGQIEIAVGSPSARTSNGIGRVNFIDTEKNLISSLNSSSDAGLGFWITTAPQDGLDLLLASEPQRDSSEGMSSGRVIMVSLDDEGNRIPHLDLFGEPNQRIGERVISLSDLNEDGVPELLMTTWQEEDDNEERQVWLRDGSTLDRLKRYYLGNNTDGSLGESMGWGSFIGSDEPLIAFGAPRVKSEDQDLTLGYVYLLNQEGQGKGKDFNPQDDLEYGSYMTHFPLNGENAGTSALVISGKGFVRVIGSTLDSSESVDFNFDCLEKMVLASSKGPDPRGLYHIWATCPSSQTVYTLFAR